MRILRLPSLYILLLWFAAAPLHALDPGRRLSQYGHTVWRFEDGFVTHSASMAQTTDGYIWLGTSNGLVRFDGSRFVTWVPPKGTSLPSVHFTSLLGDRDGSLWIGTTNGLARLKHGQLQPYTKPTEHSGISVIIQDRAGTVWVTRYRVPPGEGPLCRVEGQGLHCYGKDDGIPVTYGLGMAEDSQGYLWFGSSVLSRWRQGSPSITFFRDVLKRGKVGSGVVDVAAASSGSVWAAIDGVGPELGVRYFWKGKWTSYKVPGFDGASVRSHTLFLDRNQSLWVGTENQGLYHVHDGIADHYGLEDGLSGNSVVLIYQDREGNVWVLTDGGIDMFRDTAVMSFTIREGLSAASINSVLALRDGSVWIGNEGALDVLRDGRNTPLRSGKKLPGSDVASMLEDHEGAVWMGLDNTLTIYEHGHFHEVKKSDGGDLAGTGEVRALAEDRDHNLWALTSKSLFRISNRKVDEEFRLSDDLSPGGFLAADRETGIWISSTKGSLARYRDGHLETIAVETNESPSSTLGLTVDSDDSLLISTVHGLRRWKDGQSTLLDSRNGLPCDSVIAAIKDNYGSLWLHAKCGLLRIEASELRKWQEQPDSRIAVTVFDNLDGARPGIQTAMQPIASKGPDGRLWFGSNLLVQVVDPDRLYRNETPPPVHIEEVTADHKAYSVENALHLPALTRDLEIDYSALSFSVPQKVRFRYMLEGRDSSWQEPGTRRQALYSDLRPGNYRFRVIAANGDGVWNEEGATLAFSIAPAWHQTKWFLAICILSGLLLAWAIYRLRVRQIAKAINARFDERLAERTRMARDLHDTFLQTIQGSKMVADDALEQPTDSARMLRAMQRLSQWLGQANEEGRAVLQSLRTSTTQGNDLAEGLKRATENGFIPSSMKVKLAVIGDVREMHPIVRDEVYRIGYEAIRNACAHSEASELEVELRYDDELTLRVGDNGVGINPAIAERGRDGHFGLQGMRERAARIGGDLTIASSPASGTQITVVVPGGLVYRKQNDAGALEKTQAFWRRISKF